MHTYTVISRKYAPPSRQRPPNSFDENYCAGIISEDCDWKLV